MQVAIALYPDFTALDAIGPYQVFSYWPGAEIVLCAAQRGGLVDDKKLLHLDVDRTFDEVTSPDIVLVPGGLISRKLAHDGHPIIDWIRAVHPNTRYTTSVCTGALLLGAAELLEGLPATTHWNSYDALRSFGAEPTEQRVVHAGRIVTAAGVSAGMDLALTLVGQVDGPEVAQAIQLGLEYDPHPPYDSGSPAKAPAAIAELVREVMSSAEADVMRPSTADHDATPERIGDPAE